MTLKSILTGLLSVLGSLAVVLGHLVVLAIQLVLFGTNIVMLTVLVAVTCGMLFGLYAATGYSWYVPAALALVILPLAGYELYDRRHGWQPARLN
jgi:hypothetical protein